MVQQQTHLGLKEYTVVENLLLKNGEEISRFPTPICELARLDDRLFVVLHPYPIEDRVEYAATNLWALDLGGKILWKADNLNNRYPHIKQPNCYRGLNFFDQNNPKIYIGTMEDRTNPVIDIRTGQNITSEVIKDWRTDYDKVNKEIFGESDWYLMVLPSDPPQNSQITPPQPK